MCAKAQAILTNAHCEILDSKSKSMELGWATVTHKMASHLPRYTQKRGSMGGGTHISSMVHVS